MPRESAYPGPGVETTRAPGPLPVFVRPSPQLGSSGRCSAAFSFSQVSRCCLLSPGLNRTREGLADEVPAAKAGMPTVQG